ncbi:polysaccharide biosynthesis C-terminal domain-containing protein [Streptomyces sp. NPDC005271]|uniref:polysaccharide biosynthesis C-terminal domain-containing protein n=2 Tax=unclassified Streptomyces TaxID=2593676 RepID=UPI0033B8761F
MFNTGISAVLGLGFWLAAARYYSEDAVGQGSAAIAAMKLLAGLTAVTLTGALARFIPVAGRTTGRLVSVTYAGSSVVVALAAVVFLLTLNTWGPSYRFLHGPVNGLGFIVAVVAWSLLTLQDGVLTGLRSALWVPVGNTGFSAAKLLLLIALAAAIPTAGVFVSWVASIAVSVLPLGWLVFRRLVPRHVRTTEGTARPATYREMGRFLAGDYTGSLFSLAVVYAVPVIVASQVSAADNAYFYITTTIGGTVNLLAINMGASLTVEGSHDPARLAENCRAALSRMARIMIPVCLVLFVLAPRILGVFGDSYADAAAPLLRWFAVGAALRVVIEVYFAVLRAQSRTSGLALLQGLLCVLVLGLTLLLLPRMGLTGAGVAEISSLSVIASIAAVKLYRVVRVKPAAAAGRTSAEPSAAAAAPAASLPEPQPEPRTAPDGDLADLAVGGDRRERRERPRRGEYDSRYGTRWALRAALDADTLALGVRMDFDHPERRPDKRYGPPGAEAGAAAPGADRAQVKREAGAGGWRPGGASRPGPVHPAPADAGTRPDTTGAASTRAEANRATGPTDEASDTDRDTAPMPRRSALPSWLAGPADAASREAARDLAPDDEPIGTTVSGPGGAEDHRHALTSEPSAPADARSAGTGRDPGPDDEPTHAAECARPTDHQPTPKPDPTPPTDTTSAGTGRDPGPDDEPTNAAGRTRPTDHQPTPKPDPTPPTDTTSAGTGRAPGPDDEPTNAAGRTRPTDHQPTPKPDPTPPTDTTSTDTGPEPEPTNAAGRTRPADRWPVLTSGLIGAAGSAPAGDWGISHASQARSGAGGTRSGTAPWELPGAGPQGPGAPLGPSPAPRPPAGAGDGARPGPGPDAAPARRRARVATAALWAVVATGLALYWLPLIGMGDAELDGMGGLGLISVLPKATLVGAALLIAAFAAALRLDRPRRGLLTVVLLATVVSLHAVPAVLEAQPRFPTAWQHLGFMDYIGRTGDAVPDLDARWSWPGFFAGAAFVARACGVRDLTEVLRWWPTLIQLLYLAPLMVLVRALRASWRAKWTAAWLFALSGWVGQDYFSPQGFTYLFYLVFVAVLLVWFREPRVLRGKRWPGEAEVADATRGQRTALLGLLIALFAASVAAHQLTPFVMLGVVSALVLVRRSNLYGLPLLCGVMVVVWVGFLAEPYWSGHFDELFGGMGGVGGNVSSSVSGRIEGGSSVHKLVLYVRVALAGGVLALACWGVLRRRMAGFAERSLLVLTFVPFLGFGMQSYGGEMALRVFMFALPGACALGALALFPRVGADRRRLGPLAALVAGLTLMFGFLVARWGNETFERVRPGEVAAMEYLYAHDKPTVRVLWMSNDTVNNVTPAMPWGERDMERVSYEPTLAPRDPVRVSGLVTALRDAGPHSYLMVGRGQSVYLTLDSGYAANWQERLIRSLDGRTELRRVLSNEDAALYELKRQPRGAVPEPKPGPAGPLITWTPWSVVGALSAVALMMLLAAREVVRVAVRPSVRRLRRLQSSFWFALPLMLVLLASLVQRFVTMS